jgi:sulfite exporter TauE/SafE
MVTLSMTIGSELAQERVRRRIKQVVAAFVLLALGLRRNAREQAQSGEEQYQRDSKSHQHGWLIFDL